MVLEPLLVKSIKLCYYYHLGTDKHNIITQWYNSIQINYSRTINESVFDALMSLHMLLFRYTHLHSLKDTVCVWMTRGKYIIPVKYMNERKKLLFIQQSCRHFIIIFTWKYYCFFTVLISILQNLGIKIKHFSISNFIHIYTQSHWIK